MAILGCHSYSRLQMFYGYPTFQTAAFLENSCWPQLSGNPVSTEVEFTNFMRSRIYLAFLKSQLESRFQEVVIHQFRAKNTT
jgi:molybdopterin biosynthesis enzyme